MTTREDLYQAARQLIGKACWAVMAGGCTGSAVDFHFGERLPRPKTLTNPHLSEDERRYQGEVRLMVWCPWRVELGTSQILAASSDWDSLTQSLRTEGVKSIVGETVTDVELTPFLDLVVHLKSGKRLHLFCDETVHSHSDESCYALFLKSRDIYAVKGGAVTMESSQEV